MAAGGRRAQPARGQPARFRDGDAVPEPAAASGAAKGAAPQPPQPRPRVVVLGTGWASMSLLKALPPAISDKYDLVVVSPRNYFVYTPLLPAVAMGTMEERSIVEPVRHLIHGKGTYYEASVLSIDPAAKRLTAAFPQQHGGEAAAFPSAQPFTLDFDVLLLGVGSAINTFNVPGVHEHCVFFKSLEDAHALRHRINLAFERAALPNTSEEERRRLLSFVVCGGGPTGVEVAAELHDLVFEDLKEHYPSLMGDVSIRVVEMLDHVLSSYNRAAGAFTAKHFKREGIQLVLNTRVQSVSAGHVSVVHQADGSAEDIPFGTCIWATGLAKHPLVEQLQAAFPQQRHSRCVLTDECLRVEGAADGSMFAFGDAATIHLPFAEERLDELLAAGAGPDGRVPAAKLAQLLHAAEGSCPHLGSYARYLDARRNRFVGPLSRLLCGSPGGLERLDVAHDSLDRDQLRALLHEMDACLHALPPTAQVAKQQGEYVADLLSRASFTPDAGLQLAPEHRPFSYFHKGSLAYIGNASAVADLPLGVIAGREAGLMWKSYETIAQISGRNVLLVAHNFLRTSVFGRDMSDI